MNTADRYRATHPVRVVTAASLFDGHRRRHQHHATYPQASGCEVITWGTTARRTMWCGPPSTKTCRPWPCPRTRAGTWSTSGTSASCSMRAAEAHSRLRWRRRRDRARGNRHAGVGRRRRPHLCTRRRTTPRSPGTDRRPHQARRLRPHRGRTGHGRCRRRRRLWPPWPA